MRQPNRQGAVSVAAQLKAFAKDLRRDDLADDQRDRIRQAANDFIRRVCLHEGTTHYDVLCAAPDASREALKDNYHLVMALIHPDRQDAAGESWLTDCAQRVNHAYAVLADETARRIYDASLRHRAPAHPPPRRHRDRFAFRAATALLALTAVLGTLLLLEVWVSDISGQNSILQSALRGARARDALAASEGPRFLGRAAASTPVPAMDELPALQREPLRFPALAPWEPATPSATQAPALPIEAGYLKPAATPQIAAMAQLAAPAAPSAKRVTPREIENLVVRLVDYYEAGAADKIVDLVDAKERGYWKTLRMRQAYADFFTVTKHRRLRVESLAWQTAEDFAHAKGLATVTAEYFDAPGTQERRVDVEIDIALRDGRPVITRLSLYPDSR
jgi:hypothetical protein